MRCEENQNVQMDISSLQSRAENLKKSRKKKKRKIDSYDFNVCDDIATTKD
jgi:peptidoglycan hydrolase CwlO-like protein